MNTIYYPEPIRTQSNSIWTAAECGKSQSTKLRLVVLLLSALTGEDSYQALTKIFFFLISRGEQEKWFQKHIQRWGRREVMYLQTKLIRITEISLNGGHCFHMEDISRHVRNDVRRMLRFRTHYCRNILYSCKQ